MLLHIRYALIVYQYCRRCTKQPTRLCGITPVGESGVVIPTFQHQSQYVSALVLCTLIYNSQLLLCQVHTFVQSNMELHLYIPMEESDAVTSFMDYLVSVLYCSKVKNCV